MNRICEQQQESQDPNHKLIASSAKRIKLVLVLLIMWSFMAIGWIVHLIIESSKEQYSPSPQLSRLKKRSPLESKKFEDLVFYTTIKVTDETNWDRIKMIIGSFHQLAKENEVPFLKFFIKGKVDSLHLAEASAWHKVKLIFNESNEYDEDDAIWMSSKYVFDYVALDLKRAELVSEAEAFLKAHKKGRQLIESLFADENECVKILSSTGQIVLQNMSRKCKQSNVYEANSVGFKKIEEVTKSMKCHVRLNPESVENGASLVDFNDFSQLKHLERSTNHTIKRLAIGVPTTSKGMTGKERHVLLKALIPSIRKTLLKQELERFKIVIFIGFDVGDELFENEKWRSALEQDIEEILKDLKSIYVVFLRLLPVNRVAMTWNMIFSFARQTGKFDYFYQVNDDLTMKDSGWLSKFTSKLDSWKGIGVVGPSDSFNGFYCSLLTQAFVTERHFDIFEGNFYPLVFRDWKSDRWLSFVYGDSRTACWTEIEATNGAKGTRYEACPFPEWKIYLERDRKRIQMIETE